MAPDGQGTVAISGSSGLVGTALTESLGRERVLRLVRRREQAGEGAAFWDPARGVVDIERLEGLDAVVNLAGENLSSGRWTPERKQRIWSSRVDGTSLLARALSELERKPRVLVVASGVGYYGDRGDEPLDEEAAPGEGFIADLCRAWEAAAAPARDAGIRVVTARTGIALSPLGGMLAQMVTPFKLGVGGRIGSGKQYLSWIHLDDHVRVLERAIDDERLSGPVNSVSPNPVTNAELTKSLGRALRRPTPFPVPTFALKALMGRELTEEALLTGQRVIPRKLTDLGFEWRFPELSSALADALG